MIVDNGFVTCSSAALSSPSEKTNSGINAKQVPTVDELWRFKESRASASKTSIMKSKREFSQSTLNDFAKAQLVALPRQE